LLFPQTCSCDIVSINTAIITATSEVILDRCSGKLCNLLGLDDEVVLGTRNNRPSCQSFCKGIDFSRAYTSTTFRFDAYIVGVLQKGVERCLTYSIVCPLNTLHPFEFH